MDELKAAYIKKLAMALSMEETIIEHLPVMISSSANENLRTGLTDHLEQTRQQRQRLITILSAYGSASLTEPDEPFAAMMEQAGIEIAQMEDTDVRDAIIIASAQKVEHYEMACYGTLIQWAQELDDSDARAHLKDTLGEEKMANKKLSEIAEGGILTTGVSEKAAV